jgi:hypothetical protein
VEEGSGLEKGQKLLENAFYIPQRKSQSPVSNGGRRFED